MKAAAAILPRDGAGAASGAAGETRGLLLGFLGIAGFSLTLPMTRVAVAEIDPIVVGLGRSLISVFLAAGLLAWRRDPFPGWRPRRLGSVRSPLDATNSAPAATARPPSASIE